MSYQEWLEEQADQELVKKAEIETFRALNGFSDEDDDYDWNS